MKKITLFLSTIVMFAFVSCGPSQEEQDKQKKTDDSLMEKERNSAIDKANSILSDTTATDTVKKVETKSK
jgi:hypothetical protein